MSHVLVLNYDYTPLNVTSVQRGFILVDKGKAEIVKSDENPIVSGYKTYVRPVIIRLLRYIRQTETEYIKEMAMNVFIVVPPRI
jgi:hypothetical protein